MASSDVRVEESLRVKIGEAKNLPPHSVLGSARNTFCAIRLDREEIYRTATVEKSLDPFYGEEFHKEIPRQFRYLSFYIYDKTDKVLGKISLRKKDLYKYHNKEHWFPLLPVEANPEVQGKVHLEIRFDEYLNTNPESSVSHRLAIRVIECSDLPVTNGSCNPYAVVTVNYGKIKNREEVKRTNVKKKTICPQFEETFFFDMGVSNPRDDCAERNRGIASAPLSMVIPRVGNVHLQQNPILDSFSCTTPLKNYLSQLKKLKHIYVVSLGNNTRLENKGQNHDRNNYFVEDNFRGELSVSLWHDDSRVSREVLGSIFPGVFLGEVRLQLQDLEHRNVQAAWYFLRPRSEYRQSSTDAGSLRLNISYYTEHVFSSQYYDDLRNLLLQSLDVEPVTSSVAFILARVVDHLQDAAQPLVKIFLHNKKLVPFVQRLAEHEINRTVDQNTLFRGNTLLTKLVDELMKLVGLPYLHHTLKPIIDQICVDHLPCEIDPTRLREGENINDNMHNLQSYIEQILQCITSSGLMCPTSMCEIFFALKELAENHFPDNQETRYQVVSGFIFLRFFAPAILGPKFFDLNDCQDESVTRTLKLISKAIQWIGNVVSTKTMSVASKEDFMMPLFQALSDVTQTDAVKMYLDIISSSAKAHSKKRSTGEVPVVLKEGTLIKRAQGRKKFGIKNFKQRHFCLTNQVFMYSKCKGSAPLCVIPIEDILAVERLQEESFKMKYMFQVIQPERALYVQAANCIEEKEWLDVLGKVCAANQNRLNLYHPAAYINGHWLCCKATDPTSQGCEPVSGGIPTTNIKLVIDIDREVEKVHSLLLQNMEKLESMQDACGALEVYSGTKFSVPVEIEDTKSCFETISAILKCVISLEQEHHQYRKAVQRETISGSFESPIGDDSLVLTEPDTKL